MNAIVFHPIDPQAITDLHLAIATAIHPVHLDLNQALVEAAELPFYKDYNLFSITDLRLPTSEIYELLCGPEGAFLLDGRNEPIYRVNKLAPVRLNADTLIPYLRFFFKYAAKDTNSVRIIESVDEIPWLPDARKEVVSEASAKLVPITLKEVHENEFCRVNATVLNGDYLLLFELLVSLCTSEIEAREEDVETLALGEVRLHASNLLMTSLPVENILGDDKAGLPQTDKEESQSVFALYKPFPVRAGFDFREAPAEFANQIVTAIPEGARPKAASSEGFLLKVCDPPFYPDFCLCALRDPAITPPNVCYFLSRRTFSGQLFPMNQSNVPIYLLNSMNSLYLTQETMPSYVHFCFFMIQGPLGRFNIAEQPGDVRWQHDASDKHKQAVNELLMPITYTGLDTAGLYTLKTTVVRHKNLFRAEVKIAPQPLVKHNPETNLEERCSCGQIFLTHTEVLLEDLPVEED